MTSKKKKKKKYKTTINITKEHRYYKTYRKIYEINSTKYPNKLKTISNPMKFQNY